MNPIAIRVFAGLAAMIATGTAIASVGVWYSSHPIAACGGAFAGGGLGGLLIIGVDVWRNGMLALLLAIAAAGPSVAQPSVLVTINGADGISLSSGQPEMPFSFGVDGLPWDLIATAEDIGTSFSAPSNLLAAYEQKLVGSEMVFIQTNCCGGSSRDFWSELLVEGNTRHDPVLVTRHVPVLGPNLFGYSISDITLTVDQLTITHVSDTRYNRFGEYTIRIVGEPLPSYPPLIGDYNQNGTVDAADYSTWRQEMADNESLPLDQRPNLPNVLGDPHPASESDYFVWRLHFGQSVQPIGSLSGIGVPEPASMWLLGVCLAGSQGRPRRTSV